MIFTEGIMELPIEKHFLCCGLINSRKKGKGKERKEKICSVSEVIHATLAMKPLLSPQNSHLKNLYLVVSKGRIPQCNFQQRAWLQ